MAVSASMGASDQDLKQIWTWNSTAPEGVDACVQDLVAETVRRKPSANALVASDGSLSFHHLDTLSTKVAHHLAAMNVQQGDIVPLCFEKSMWTVVAMLGVMKVGAASILLDCCQPEERLRTVVQEVGAKTILCSTAQTSLASNIADITALVISESTIAGFPSSPSKQRPQVSPADLLYCIATSGTTGTPKVVCITHRNMCSAIVHQQQAFGFDDRTRFLDFSSYAFDLSWFILHVLVAGGTICIPNDDERRSDLVGSINKFNASAILLTPTLARLMDKDSVPTMQKILLGGEAVSKQDANAWGSTKMIYNAYGPAECTIVTISSRISDCSDRDPPIGVGSAATTWVVDPDSGNDLSPLGSVGELWLEGPLVGRGYLNEPEKTAAVFIDSPPWLVRGGGGQSGRHGRVYRTGDLVKYEPDGTLTYVSRKDRQVKIRGQRVELSEVEHAVRELLPSGTNTQVSANVIEHPASGAKSIAVFMSDSVADTASDSGNSTLELSQKFNGALAERLPTYMIPSLYISIPSFPIGPTGKLDWSKLREIATEKLLRPQPTFASENSLLPKSQAKLRAIWAKVLRVEEANISPTDTFFGLGGDSISIMSLVMAIRREYGVQVPVFAFGRPDLTINKLAGLLERNQESYSKIDDRPPRFDPQAIAEMLASKFRFPRIVRGEQASDSCQSFSVFLTGATGYLGIHLLHQLIESETVRRVIALVRPNGDRHNGLQRIRKAATLAGWWNEERCSKLEVWEGDLSLSRFGLSQTQWSALCGQHGSKECEVIIHNGAAVHWSADYKALKATNVDSTHQLLRAAISSPALKRFVYISGGRLIQDQDDSTEYEDTGYDQTKQVSERLVLKVASKFPKQPGKFSVVRPGLIIGNPEAGIANTDDFIWRLVKSCIELRARPFEPPNSRLLISDADSVSLDVLRHLIAKSPCEILHVFDTMTVSRFWQLIEDFVKLPLRAIDWPDWRSLAMREIDRQQESHPLWPVIDFLNEPLGTTDQGSWERSRAELGRLERAVTSNIAYLCSCGFIPGLVPQSNASTGQPMWSRQGQQRRDLSSI